MTQATSLMDKYKGAGEGPSHSESQKIFAYKPDWDKYDAAKNYTRTLSLLELGTMAIKNKALIQDNIGALTACMEILKSVQDDKIVKWILTLFYEMLREDSSCYGLFESALQNNVPVSDPLMAVLGRAQSDTYLADKASWVLSAIIGHMPRFFKEDKVKAVLVFLFAHGTPCSDLGVLDAVTNLLKSYECRKFVWEYPGVKECIFKVEAKTASPPHLYKCMFAIWMASFDPEFAPELKRHQVIKKIKDILTTSRVEKVVRICLTLLKNLLAHKGLGEEIVEEGMLEAVQNLEFEKWRDAELYDDIHDMVALISSEVNELSNFDRYQRELQSGNLSWGFIHSTKFWAENVKNFEKDDFRALKVLANLLTDTRSSPTTLAVACHDVGEFVSVHPLGKKMVAKLGVKEKVMELMGSQDYNKREVRREALLCCQKIMLNKWQDLDTP